MFAQTDFIILGLLGVESDQSGYDIRKTIQGSVGYFWNESYGQIYPALKRLAAAGFITAQGSTTTGSRPQRQAYSLTASGRKRFEEWLAVPYREDPRRDEFLLKLFFGGEADVAVSIGHIQEFQAKNRRLLATLQELSKLSHERNATHPHFPFWILTLNFGLAQIRSALEWSESALRMLSEPTSDAVITSMVRKEGGSAK